MERGPAPTEVCMSAGRQAGERWLELHSVLGWGSWVKEWLVPRNGSQTALRWRGNLGDKVAVSVR